MATRRFNEGKACDAVIKRLEAREGHSREEVHFPERDGDAAPIEVSFKIGRTLFALEHTGIEPFSGQVQLQAQAAEHFGPIHAMLDGKLPSGVIELMIPARATQRLSARQLPAVQKALAAWIETNAPTLPLSPYARYVTPLENVRPPKVPFPVSLYRFETMGFPSRLQIIHVVSELDGLRESRIRTACQKKFPKLEAWQKAGARSVLVLEDTDIQLTNAQVVFEALAKHERTCPGRPDKVYMVSSYAKDWFVHALRVGDRTYYDLSNANQCLSEVDSTTLTDLTGR